MGLRILHVIAGVAPRYGGPSTAVFGMCRALQASGLEPVVVTTDADGPHRLAVPLGSMVPFDGVPTVFFPRQWSEGLKYSRPLARWLEGHVADFDVVHVHGVFSHACLAAAGAARRHGVPYVVRALGMLDPWSLGRRRLAKRIAWPLGVSRLLAGAVAIHYTTAEEQRLAERLRGLAPGVVIPLGVDDRLLEFASLATRPAAPNLDGLAGHPYVLALSRLHAKKGLELLVDAFLKVTADEASMRRWRLILAGDGDPRYVTGLRARARNGGGRILFPGWLDGPRKHAILAGASLLALPSHQENFGLAAIEALACGVPVLVSTDVNLADEIRAAGAGWVTPLAPDALRAALGAALREGPGLASRGAAGRALVRARFTWSRVSAALVDLYGAVSRREPALAVSSHGEGTWMTGQTGRIPVSVIVLTKDEALNLPACLESVAEWAAEVLVVDSGSTDGTPDTAASLGATVFAHAFESHAKQWGWALRSLPISGEWVLALDADQRVTPELRREIARATAGGGGHEEPVAYYVPRRQVFRGRWIRHGGYYPKHLLKLFRRGEAWCDDRDLVDHHFYVKGPVGRLRGDLLEDNGNEADLSVWIAKHARYAALQAREELVGRWAGADPAAPARLFGTPDERTRWLKRWWAHLPLYVRPFLYFGYRYVLRGGFLDGKEGFVFHFLQGFWYRLLVDVHLDRLRAEARGRR